MTITKKVSASILSVILYTCTNAYAFPIGNAIEGVGPVKNKIYPIFCIQQGNGQVTASVEHGNSVDGNKFSGNKYYVGGALRFGGCKDDNAYLGYLGVNTSAQAYVIAKYEAPKGSPIALITPGVTSDGVITGSIQYTEIKYNPDLLTSPPAVNSTWEFTGINLSGLEFGKMIDPSTTPNLSKQDAESKYSDLADTQTFLNAGMNTIRVPISWGYIQLEGAGKGELNVNYYNAYIKPLLETLTNAHVNTIVDLHAYMRFSEFGKQYSGCGASGPCPDGSLVTDAKALEDVWLKMLALIKSDPKINMNYIMFDLMNEPVGVPDDLVFTMQAQVIKALRANGFTGYILVEGNNWTGLHSWKNKSWKSSDGKIDYTNATLFTRDNFAKAGINDLSKILINVHQYMDVDYSGTHDTCQTNLMTEGEEGFNLAAFVDYLKENKLKAIITEFGAGRDSATCAPALNQFLQYLKNNSANGKEFGFVGWTIWSTGHGWGDYNLRVIPTSYQFETIKGYGFKH